MIFVLIDYAVYADWATTLNAIAVQIKNSVMVALGNFLSVKSQDDCEIFRSKSLRDVHDLVFSSFCTFNVLVVFLFASYAQLKGTVSAKELSIFVFFGANIAKRDGIRIRHFAQYPFQFLEAIKLRMDELVFNPTILISFFQ